MKKKKCTKCNKIKLFNEFNNNKRTHDKLSFYCKKCNSESRVIDQRKWRENNPEEYKKRNREYKRKLYSSNPLHHLKQNCRDRLNLATKNVGFTKNGSSKELLGCNYNTLKEHLEEQFTGGMSWDNQGEWHIDHIIPLSSANNKEELYQLFHYKNLQPLWAKDNLSKGKKLLKNF